MVEPYKPLYTVKEVSKLLKVNTDSVYDLIKKRQLPALRLGAMKIRGTDLERFIEKYPTGEVGETDQGIDNIFEEEQNYG